MMITVSCHIVGVGSTHRESDSLLTEADLLESGLSLLWSITCQLLSPLILRRVQILLLRWQTMEHGDLIWCPLFRGCLSIEVNAWTAGTFGIVCYIVGVRC